MPIHRNKLIALAIAALLSLPAHGWESSYRNTADAMMGGRNGAKVTPLLTIGETIKSDDGTQSYTPVGTLDGLGAYRLDASTVRVWANHELSDDKGYSYRLANGTRLTGARISYFDIDQKSRVIRQAGIAYDQIHDRAGQIVTTAEQINGPGSQGFDRFCSASMFEANSFGDGRGFRDRIYFANEERSSRPGGTVWAGDVAQRSLWAAPALGRGAWENVAQIDTGTRDKIALLLGDDSVGAPLYLYVGTKSSDAHSSFLDRNGLQHGKLYAWKSAQNDLDPSTFHGSAAKRDGSWVELQAQAPTQAGRSGYDAIGYADDSTLRSSADQLGAFSFSRPEDLHINPKNGRQIALASTGRADFADGSDKQGKLYLIDLRFDPQGNPSGAIITILYDGDADPALKLRSPDNIGWGNDGHIYVQEDAAYDWDASQNPTEARIVAIDPATGQMTTVAEINRLAVKPTGSSDAKPDSLGVWESSGIVEVSTLFDAKPGSLYLFDVQAHGIKDGLIASQKLVEGGQLLWLDVSQVVEPR